MYTETSISTGVYDYYYLETSDWKTVWYGTGMVFFWFWMYAGSISITPVASHRFVYFIGPVRAGTKACE